MIRSVLDQFDEWDQAIPWLVFAYREVPVAGVGFSPFELLFGRHVRGPLSLLKADWLEGPDVLEDTTKRHVLDYFLDLREKLRLTLGAAAENYAKQQETIKHYFDRNAKPVGV